MNPPDPNDPRVRRNHRAEWERLDTIATRIRRRLGAGVHELRCTECRVTWKSWAQRLLGDRRGYRPVPR